MQASKPDLLHGRGFSQLHDVLESPLASSESPRTEKALTERMRSLHSRELARGSTRDDAAAEALRVVGLEARVGD